MKEENSVVEPELTEIAEAVTEQSEPTENPTPTEPTESSETPPVLMGMMKGIPVSDDSPIISFRQSVWDYI